MEKSPGKYPPDPRARDAFVLTLRDTGCWSRAARAAGATAKAFRTLFRRDETFREAAVAAERVAALRVAASPPPPAWRNDIPRRFSDRVHRLAGFMRLAR